MKRSPAADIALALVAAGFISVWAFQGAWSLAKKRVKR